MPAGGPTGGHVLRGAIKGRRRSVVAASLLGMGHQTCEALVPVIVGVIIDEAVAKGSSGTLLQLLVLLGVVFLVLSTCYRVGARITEAAGEQATHRLRLDLGARVLDPRGGADADRLPGALTSIATNDARRVGAAVTVLSYGASALAALAVSAVALLRISVPLGLLVLLGIPPLLWLGHRISGPLERRSETEQERAAHASGVAADLVDGLRVLKGMGAESAAVSRYRRTSQDSLAAALRAARSRAGHEGAVLALTGVFIAVIAVVGAYLAMRGTISVGELVAAVGLAQFLLGPFQLLTFVNAEFAQGRASARRIAEVLAAPAAVEPGGAALPDPVAGRLRLRGVTLGALRGVDLDLAPGSLTGVVTGDPAAAQDLLRCLAREADPADGQIELDGVPLTDLHPDDVRRAVLVAPHDADLFETSLLDNVRGPDTPATAVERALTASAADEVARLLPDGADGVLTERGRSLSGGQRQRVALARALAADRPVLVLHDPTTAVDTVTESRIAARLRDLRRDRTTVLVTTSPALLAVTDRVVVLDGGAVTAEGRHADLVAADPAYRAAVLA
ncbi:ABC transporter ATP-binding protein [Streptomyces virens]|uniref:ABC transporter ATP-binding protein n=1 Tax=Streptomyces virens TaxID=285572 RepID=A0ABP6PF65_9ACTN|nr:MULTISPECIES: ABC transporter ATP-binding protein [Streptomyces]MBA8976603.1 putative ABC transport system ATP-binding protein [Streptomyces calvus]MYS30437.1 ATP-binding cassette domain-containing protein [Streptomyces sp. SID7804]